MADTKTFQGSKYGTEAELQRCTVRGAIVKKEMVRGVAEGRR